MRKGKAVMPPSATKFPAAKGDHWKLGRSAPKTGRFASQEPKMKKHAMENQHMQSMTPHCSMVNWARKAISVRITEVFEVVGVIGFPLSIPDVLFGLDIGRDSALVTCGTSSKYNATKPQKTT